MLLFEAPGTNLATAGNDGLVVSNSISKVANRIKSPMDNISRVVCLRKGLVQALYPKVLVASSEQIDPEPEIQLGNELAYSWAWPKFGQSQFQHV